MSQRMLYSIVLTSVHSDDLALQIVQRTSPEYHFIRAVNFGSLQYPSSSLVGFSTYSLALQCLVTLCHCKPAVKPSDRPCLYGVGKGPRIARILLTHSIRNPLSFLLNFFSQFFGFYILNTLQKCK